MSLEHDIHQPEFKNEYHKALINIIYTNNHLLDRMNSVFDEFDVTLQQYNVLRILKGQYPSGSSINLIKERMLNKMSDASRIVQRLEQKRLISRTTTDQDLRATLVTITSKGLLLLEDMQPRIDQFEQYLHNLSPHEVHLLNEFLDKSRIPVVNLKGTRKKASL